jgi:hypothetical protein
MVVSGKVVLNKVGNFPLWDHYMIAKAVWYFEGLYVSMSPTCPSYTSNCLYLQTFLYQRGHSEVEIKYNRLELKKTALKAEDRVTIFSFFSLEAWLLSSSLWLQGPGHV